MTELQAFTKACELVSEIARGYDPAQRIRLVQLALLSASEQGAIDALDQVRDRMVMGAKLTRTGVV